jgi:hypothetical protein
MLEVNPDVREHVHDNTKHATHLPRVGFIIRGATKHVDGEVIKRGVDVPNQDVGVNRTTLPRGETPSVRTAFGALV